MAPSKTEKRKKDSRGFNGGEKKTSTSSSSLCCVPKGNFNRLEREISLFRCRKSCVFEAGDTGLEWGGEGGLQQPALRSVWLHAHRVLQQVRGLGLTLPLQAGAGQDMERETGKIYL